MEFKRFKRKGLIFNNNSIGLGLEARIGKKIKVFRIERLTKEDKSHNFIIYDGGELVGEDLKKEIVNFLNKEEFSYFEGEPRVWQNITLKKD